MQGDNDEDIEHAHVRRNAFMKALDPAIGAREDSIPRRIRALNASPITKLRKIFSVLDDIATAVAPFVACAKGCSACCCMNVTISPLEARLIHSVTGRRFVPLRASRGHDLAEFNGVPCPFLKDSACTIYADRPFACRKHYTSAFWCQPERSAEKQLPLVQFSGAEEAYFDVVRTHAEGVLADIRDFFPAETRDDTKLLSGEDGGG